MSKNCKRTAENAFVEMCVKFWEPYAVRMATRDIDVIKSALAWLPRISGMTVEQMSPYEVLLHGVPSVRVLEISGIVKSGVVNEFGWEEEPSNVVSVGVVLADMGEDSRRRGLFFRKPRCMYTEKTPGYVRLDDGLGLAVLTEGTFRGDKVILYLHGEDEDIFESRESLKPFMPPTCNLALVAYTGYGLSFGNPREQGCYDSAHRVYDWVNKELGYRPEDILIVGYSLGASVALELAQTCDSNAVLLLAPFYSGVQALMDWSGESIGRQTDSGPFPSNAMIQNVKCPVAVVHGDKDDTYLCERGRSLYELAPNQAGFTLVSGAGNCDLLAKLGAVQFRGIVSELFEM